ncbi:MAG: UbiD family decarboxylase [Peptococcaceae bacterium]|jgi:UbiD family decarboxylase|nr:UbiD family decarboxylase [Peptococcaceae bacterium]
MTADLPATATRADEGQSLRGFLASLDDDQLIRYTVRRRDFLLGAIVDELEKRDSFPVVQLTDPDTGAKTVANTFANRDILKGRVHNIMDVERKALEFGGLEMVRNPPCQQNVREGALVDLSALPVFRHFPGDAGPYITSGVVIARDPENGRHNFSFHRMQIKGKNKIGVSLHSRGDLWRYMAASEAAGKDLEIAVFIGAHPAYYIVGASKVPPPQDDYSWAGAYMNAVPKVAKSVRAGIPVPAFAEYVLEGRVLANAREDEGPFGEYTGYSTSRSTRNVFMVDAITYRNDAIWQDLVPGFAWEHLLLSQLTKEIILLNKLRQEIPEVKALCLPKNGCHFHAYLSMSPQADGQAKQAMLLLFGLDPYLKLIIAVNEDVNVFNEQEVWWATATRTQADRDVFIVPRVLCNRLDPSSEDGMAAKMGIDATKPAGWDAQRLSLPESAREQALGLIQGQAPA